MLSSRIRTAGIWLALCLMPALLGFLVKETQIPVPGNSQHNDPDWYYLGNALQLAVGHRAFLMEHPGLPLSVLGGAFLWLKLKFLPVSPEPDFVAEVFQNSPEYHRYLGDVGLCLTMAALLCYGLFLHRRLLPLWAAVACQGLMLWTPQMIWFTGRWMPEGMAVLLGCVYGIFYLAQMNREQGKAAPFMLGGFLGTLVSVKINYFSFCLVALVQGWRKAPIVGAAAAFVFGAFTLALQPDRARFMLYWYPNLLKNKGMHGAGEPGLPGLAEMAANLAKIGQEHGFSFQYLLWGLGLAVLASLLSLRWRERRHQVLVLLGVLIIVLNVLSLGKHPGARYALPIFVFLPTLLAAFWAAERAVWARTVMGAAVAGAIVSGARLAEADYRNMRLEASAVSKREREIEALFRAKPECMYLFHDSVASYRCSNFSANGFTGGFFTERLNALYPRTWVFRASNETFFNFSGFPHDAAKFGLLKAASCVMFYVRKEFPDPLKLPVFRARSWKTLYENSQVVVLYSGPPR